MSDSIPTNADDVFVNDVRKKFDELMENHNKRMMEKDAIIKQQFKELKEKQAAQFAAFNKRQEEIRQLYLDHQEEEEEERGAVCKTFVIGLVGVTTAIAIGCVLGLSMKK